MENQTSPEELVLAFPENLRERAHKTIEFMRPTRYSPQFGFEVVVEGEALNIPDRIYNPEVARVERHGRALPLVSHCLYTRHHDGHVRQRHLIRLINAKEPWVVPFVLRLLGEYIVEILEVLAEHREQLSTAPYTEFTANNPEFVKANKSRIVSYWDCYYREQFPNFTKYPGYVAANSLGWWSPKDIPHLRKG